MNELQSTKVYHFVHCVIHNDFSCVSNLNTFTVILCTTMFKQLYWTMMQSGQHNVSFVTKHNKWKHINDIYDRTSVFQNTIYIHIIHSRLVQRFKQSKYIACIYIVMNILKYNNVISGRIHFFSFYNICVFVVKLYSASTSCSSFLLSALFFSAKMVK